MGCRPSRHSLGRVGDSAWSYNKSYMPEMERVKQKHKRCGRGGRRKMPTYSAFSSTSKTYFDRDSKTSKITVRLSTDGSTLEIERYDIDLGDQLQQDNPAENSDSYCLDSSDDTLRVPQPSGGLQKSASAPELPLLGQCIDDLDDSNRGEQDPDEITVHDNAVANGDVSRTRVNKNETQQRRPHSLIVDPNIHIRINGQINDGIDLGLPVIKQPTKLPAIPGHDIMNMHNNTMCNCQKTKTGSQSLSNGGISYNSADGSRMSCGSQLLCKSKYDSRISKNGLVGCYNDAVDRSVGGSGQSRNLLNEHHMSKQCVDSTKNKRDNSEYEGSERVLCCFCLSSDETRTEDITYCPVPVSYEGQYSSNIEDKNCRLCDGGGLKDKTSRHCHADTEIQTVDLFTENKIDFMNGSMFPNGMGLYEAATRRCENGYPNRGTNDITALNCRGVAYSSGRGRFNNRQNQHNTRYTASGVLPEKQTTKLAVNGGVQPLIMNEKTPKSIDGRVYKSCDSSCLGHHDSVDSLECVNIDSGCRLLNNAASHHDVHSEDDDDVLDNDDDLIDDDDEDEEDDDSLTKSEDFNPDLPYFEREYDIFDYIDDDIYLDARVCQTHVFDHVHRSPGAYRLGGTNNADDDDDDDSDIYDDEVDENDDADMGDDDSDTDDDQNDIYIDAVESTYV